jgi:hypothetical protein
MSHAGGRDGDTTSTATTLGSVVEQGCKALAQPFSSGWLRGHPTSYYSACHGSTLLTGGVEGAHQRNVSRGLMSLRTASSRVQEVAGDDGQAPALQLLTHDQRIDDHAVRSSAFSRFLALHAARLLHGYDTRRYTRRCWWWRRDGACAWYVWHGLVGALAIRSCGTALSATALPRCWVVCPHTNLPPVITQRRVPEKRQDGWVEPSPLCGFQDLPAPTRSQASDCGDTMLGGVEARVAREENPN